MARRGPRRNPGARRPRGGGRGHGLSQARWWLLRPAQNLKPATYTCPICGRHLPALSEHVLIAPEGDKSRRRHAHTECVMRARKEGRLPTEEEWRATQPRPPSLWSRLRAALSSRSGGS